MKETYRHSGDDATRNRNRSAPGDAPVLAKLAASSPGGRWQVSTGGGSSPRWRRDGQEMFYLSSDNKITAAEVRAHASSFEIGAIRTLFETRPYGVFGRFDVTADGQRFIVAYDAGASATAITLVVNWPGLEAVIHSRRSPPRAGGSA